MSKIRTEQVGRVMTVFIDNPPHNFLTSGMMADLEKVYIALEKDKSVGAVVITGAVEGTFVTHFDVEEILRGTPDHFPAIAPFWANVVLRAIALLESVPGLARVLRRTPAAGVQDLLRYHRVCARMNRLDKVFIAAINGTALGGGCELALACDVRMMADGPFAIGQPEVILGLLPGGGGTQRLTHAVGTGRAIELMLDGRHLLPREARDVGLVHEVVPPSELLERAQGLARRLATRAPGAVRAIKRAVYEGSSGPLRSGLAMERAAFLSAGSAPRTRDAMATYLEQVQRLTAAKAPLALEHMTPWAEGTAVDFTS